MSANADGRACDCTDCRQRRGEQTFEDVRAALGLLASCIAIPASDRPGARFVRSDAEVQDAYLKALHVLTCCALKP